MAEYGRISDPSNNPHPPERPDPRDEWPPRSDEEAERMIAAAKGDDSPLEAALSACQEELAQVKRIAEEYRMPLGKAQQEASAERKKRQAAEAARDELARVGHRVLILDDAELGEVSEAHVAVIGELRAALSSEATKGDAE